MKKYVFEQKPVDKLNLGEKELRCSKIDLEYRESLASEIANWSDNKRAALLAPVNNDVDSDFKFRPIEVPLDRDGYCQSFSFDKTQAISDFFSVYGFVVIRDILSEEAIEDTKEEIWDFIERHVPSVNRNKPLTWDTWMSKATFGQLGDVSVLSPQFAVSFCCTVCVGRHIDDDVDLCCVS